MTDERFNDVIEALQEKQIEIAEGGDVIVSVSLSDSQVRVEFMSKHLSGVPQLFLYRGASTRESFVFMKRLDEMIYKLKGYEQ